jgi:hypothetical protein
MPSIEEAKAGARASAAAATASTGDAGAVSPVDYEA